MRLKVKGPCVSCPAQFHPKTHLYVDIVVQDTSVAHYYALFLSLGNLECEGSSDEETIVCVNWKSWST